jgi:hypothetical protein
VEHSITVEAYSDEFFSDDPLDGVTYFYSLVDPEDEDFDDSDWGEDLPLFTDVTGDPITVYVKATKEGYRDTYGDSNVGIYPAELELVWPTASSIVEGSLLSTSILSGGSTAFGSFSWDNGSLVPALGSGSYKVIFTPNENTLKNYNGDYPLVGEVTLTVTAKPPTNLQNNNTQGANNIRNARNNGATNVVTEVDGTADSETLPPTDTPTTSGTPAPTSIGKTPTPLDDGNSDGGLSTSTIIILAILLLLLLAILATYFIVRKHNKLKEV